MRMTRLAKVGLLDRHEPSVKRYAKKQAGVPFVEQEVEQDTGPSDVEPTAQQ